MWTKKCWNTEHFRTVVNENLTSTRNAQKIMQHQWGKEIDLTLQVDDLVLEPN